MRKLVAAGFFALCHFMNGQHRFDHLSVTDGLSQNSVNDIFQDSEGYLWFATQDGLNRFDGYEFTWYMEDGDIPMSHNFLWSIVEDQYGNIWTASSKGATRLNWKEGKSTHFFYTKNERYEGERNQVARVFLRDDQVIISFASSSTFAIDPLAFPDSSSVILSSEHLLDYKALNLPDQPIFNTINVGHKQYFLFYDKIVGESTVSLPDGYFLGIFSSDLLTWGNGFFVSTNNGLLYYDVAEKSFSTFPCLSEPVFDLIMSPANNQIWVATGRGIVLFDPVNSTCMKSIQSGDDESDLSSSLVSSFAKSKDGIYWVGTANGGINIYDQKRDQFKYLKQAQGFSDKPVWCFNKTKTHLLVGTDNGLYVASHKGALTKSTFAVDQVIASEKIEHPHFANKRITAIEEVSPNKFVIGTHSAELILFNPITKKSTLLKLNEDNRHPHTVSAIKKIGADVWVTTHNGLFKFSRDLKHKTFYSYWNDPLIYPSNYYLSAYVSKDSTLWLGTNIGFSTISADGEIEYFFYDDDSLSKSPAFNFISGFFEDSSGKIWISTFGGGVSRFDRKTGEFFHLTRDDGLANNICSSILGNDEFVFVTTNGGLSKVRIKDNQIINYKTSDGLISNEFAIASSFQTGGEFFFGTVNGLVAFNPKELEESFAQEAPVVSKLAINYTDVSLHSLGEKGLELYPEDKIFTVEFSNLSFRKNDQVNFAYRMLGFDENWVTTSSSNRRATYSLAPGEYEFQLKSKVGGLESETSTLLVQVHPAFYETWWFALIATLSIGLGIVFVSRYYSHQQLKKRLQKLELQQKIQKERERISRDLHDNVGSQITYIASSIDNISGNGSTPELKELGDFTRDTMRQLRETIWVINHDEVSVEELKVKVVDYLSEILKPHSHIRQDVRFADSDEKLVPTAAINIFRIIQEAVNNAVKHANPSLITVSLEIGGDSRLTVSDDGSGFDGNDKDGHFGLINMRSRAQDLGAQLRLTSSEKEGTRIEVTGLKIGQMT